MRYANKQPPTKEQVAQAALFELNKEYTFALGRVTSSIREAYALVRRAEMTPGVDVQMLSEWFNQYSRELETFHALRKEGTDEVDDAGPIEAGEIIEADWSDVP